MINNYTIKLLCENKWLNNINYSALTSNSFGLTKSIAWRLIAWSAAVPADCNWPGPFAVFVIVVVVVVSFSDLGRVGCLINVTGYGCCTCCEPIFAIRLCTAALNDFKRKINLIIQFYLIQIHCITYLISTMTIKYMCH